jgi:hypothetical protein
MKMCIRQFKLGWVNFREQQKTDMLTAYLVNEIIKARMVSHKHNTIYVYVAFKKSLKQELDQRFAVTSGLWDGV